jgi:hypothetical protein
MQLDAYLMVANAFACPLKGRASGKALYQLWRVDFKALRRLALVCKEASVAVKLLLWTSTDLGARELQRRRRVQLAQAFLREPVVAPLLASIEWTTQGQFYRVRVSVAFNGRICIKEYSTEGSQIQVGLTLTGMWHGQSLSFYAFDTTRPGDVVMSCITFEDRDGALCGLRNDTYLGHHWRSTHEMEERRLQLEGGRWKRGLSWSSHSAPTSAATFV